MALLYMSKPFPLADLELWVQPNRDGKRCAFRPLVHQARLIAHRQKDEALTLLQRLHILTLTPASKDNPQTLSLTKNFGTSLRLALTGGGDHQSFGVPSNGSIAEDVDLEFLDEYARRQWEGILHYVVNSVGEGMGQTGQGPTLEVKQLLEVGNLVTRGRHAGGITQAGFSFLLQEVNAQVWSLLVLWLDNAKEVCDIPSIEVESADRCRWGWILLLFSRFSSCSAP